MALKTQYKLIFAGIGIVGVLFGVRAGMQAGWIPTPSALKSMIPQKADIATLGGNIQMKPVASYDLPAAPDSHAPQREVLIIPWQAAGSLALANGGTGTESQDTLMVKYAGANITLGRQDDYGKMADEMTKFAQGRKAGQPNPGGAAAVVLMGGGEAAWIAGLQPQMDKLGYHLRVFGITGFSHGEDKCMGPDTSNGTGQQNPQKFRGALIAASPRDGDWDVCVKLAADNNIPVNSDGTAYDPDAINFVDTDGFQTADDKYISGACEDRNEVKAGVKTGKKVHVCVNGVATWTPGDVTVIDKRSTTIADASNAQSNGVKLVTWASTKEYDQQMPAVLVGIKEDLEAHPAFYTGMLRAIDRASFQIRTTQDGVHQMAVAEAKVFGTSGGDEADPAYWERYFAGYDSPDGKVNLGGSRVSTLAEVRDFVGLSDGTLNIYKGVYTVFGKYDVVYYPTIVPSVPDFDSVMDYDYIKSALQGVSVAAAKPDAQFASSRSMTTAVSSRAVSIEFDTGTATIRPTSRAVLDDIANSASETKYLIQINGHTDNTGDANKNVALSRARAQAVADALNAMAPNTFPTTRMEVNGYGGDKPIADNSTAQGRQKNRRVEIVLGN